MISCSIVAALSLLLGSAVIRRVDAMYYLPGVLPHSYDDKEQVFISFLYWFELRFARYENLGIKSCARHENTSVHPHHLFSLPRFVGEAVCEQA
jgi:hypothetical protein